MRQASLVKSLTVVGVGVGASAAAIWLSSKPNRILAKDKVREWKRKVKPTPFDKSENLPLEKGGNPHPRDIEDNNMVSEGAMYSVQFFNEKVQ
jgi:thioredoxin reductase